MSEPEEILEDPKYPRWRARCLKYFTYYAKECLKIQVREDSSDTSDTTGGSSLQPFKLKNPQLIIEAVIKDIKSKGRLVRVVLLKARRQGASTEVVGRLYWHTSTKFNRYAVIVTHEPEASEFIFQMAKRFHNLVPKMIQPAQTKNNARLLEFNTPDGTGLDSAIRVGTAGKKDYGSGMKANYLLLSEVAKWDKNIAPDLLTSILQTVPEDPDTEVFLESTAKGIGGEFHARFTGAKHRYIAQINKKYEIVYEYGINGDADESNEFSMIFIPWYIDSGYKTSVDKYKEKTNADFILRTDEQKMMEEHNLIIEQMVWRRLAIANKCGGNVETFWQEYPTTWEEAFLTSGSPLFDNKKLEVLKKAAPKPIARYNLSYHNGQWVADENGKLRVWKEPEPGRHYIIGADVAEGLSDGDFSCADVIDHLTGEQVAQFHGKIDLDLYAQVLFHFGTRYNNAWLGVEKNNAGVGVINRLHNDLEYGKLYVEQIPDPPNKPKNRYGWVTGKNTKPEMVQYLVEDIREDSHGIKCAETFGEMMSFKEQDDGKLEADAGCFDDRVLSIAIAKILRVRLPAPHRTNRPTGGFQVKDRIGQHKGGKRVLKGII